MKHSASYFLVTSINLKNVLWKFFSKQKRPQNIWGIKKL